MSNTVWRNWQVISCRDLIHLSIIPTAYIKVLNTTGRENYGVDFLSSPGSHKGSFIGNQKGVSAIKLVEIAIVPVTGGITR